MTSNEPSSNPVANAPVSFGAFERTVGAPGVPSADAVLRAVAAAGYDGIDLGPPGYLRQGGGLGEVLAGHGLHLAGGYVELPFADPAALGRAWGELDAVLDDFDGAATAAAYPPPRPTIAHAPTPVRIANPGRAANDPSLAWSPSEQAAVADGVAEALERCRARGYEPTFHPELGTPVECTRDIEALLSVTAIGLCLDTGHLLAAGGDPAGAALAFADRINHVHVKDARIDVMRSVVDGGEPVDAVWERGVFCPLGHGDLDGPALLEALQHTNYRGWIIVEQDSLPGGDAGFRVALEAQQDNRAYLRRHGL